MNLLIKWLREYNTEYNSKTKVLKINKPIPVREFMLLREVLKPYMNKINDIIVGM